MKKIMMIITCSLFLFAGVWLLSDYFNFDLFIINIIISILSFLFLLPASSQHVWGAPTSWAAMNADNSIAQKREPRIHCH